MLLACTENGGRPGRGVTDGDTAWISDPGNRETLVRRRHARLLGDHGQLRHRPHSCLPVPKRRLRLAGGGRSTPEDRRHSSCRPDDGDPVRPSSHPAGSPAVRPREARDAPRRGHPRRVGLASLGDHPTLAQRQPNNSGTRGPVHDHVPRLAQQRGRHPGRVGGHRRRCGPRSTLPPDQLGSVVDRIPGPRADHHRHHPDPHLHGLGVLPSLRFAGIRGLRGFRRVPAPHHGVGDVPHRAQAIPKEISRT